ncbi:MAG: HD domain-containing phosphohydrolase [Anaerolineales bacterium]|jgi:HD-GYP domain-containing protein (c-di-GMP phosphodiesterase class II)
MLQAVITALPILILEIDEDGIILGYNSDSPSLFDVHPESFLNRHLSTYLPNHVEDELQIVLSAIRNAGQPPLINYSMVVDDEEHWFEARFIASNRGRNTVVIQDVTRHKINEARVQKQLEQMSALRAIDQAITSSVDLNLTLSILLTQLVKHLQIDAACILLWNAETERLEYVAGLGFRTNSLTHTKLRLGEGFAGMAALERRVIKKEHLSGPDTDFVRSPMFGQEGFVSYFGVPLIAKGQVQGILEIFNRSLINPDTEWLSFLEMLGGQAAIAVDNATLFSDLQRSNIEITSAYDATIIGWSRALDMRDHETEGHTQRVTEMTLKLAHHINIPEEELIHIRRGATLHDIGKMGIPDRILHKPGPLTTEEWGTMRQHPKFAYALLMPISYLRPAKDIPYYHHERWDGSGYPRGLKGEEIPLSARLFAVVDVYDALTSDRPYRSAWSKQAALNYIQDEAGRLFDPNIVSTFLELVQEKEPVSISNTV